MSGRQFEEGERSTTAGGGGGGAVGDGCEGVVASPETPEMYNRSSDLARGRSTSSSTWVAVLSSGENRPAPVSSASLSMMKERRRV